MTEKAIVWIRDDFRLKNNPALSYASNEHKSISVISPVVTVLTFSSASSCVFNVSVISVWLNFSLYLITYLFSTKSLYYSKYWDLINFCS